MFVLDVTMASVRLQLAKEEAAAAKLGSSVTLHTDVSPAKLITAGLELEETQ